MPFTESDLGAFGALTTAIGLTRSGGANNPDWFGDPVGGTGTGHTNARGFATILSDDDQRRALEDFVDEILGPPQGHDEDTARWVPLFQNADPHVTVYAVLEPTGAAGNGTVRVGVGLEHSTSGTAPNVTTRIHVPIAHVPRGTDTRPSDGPNPTWFLLGRVGGRIGIEVEATFTDAAPVPREAYLRGAKLGIGIPTGPEDVEFTLALVDLQVPGALTPTTQTLTLDDLSTVGPDLLQFLVGLIKAQVAALDANDPTYKHIVGLAGMLGLRDGVPDLPSFPVDDLLGRGLPALVAWVESILDDDAALDAWLGEVALLTGGDPHPERNAVSVDLGPCSVTVGLGVAPGAGGHPVLTPWVEIDYNTRTGALARAHVDVLRADTATSQVSAVPSLSAEAVFGVDAGGAALITGASPHIGSLHVGVGLDAQHRPALLLTLHDVVLPGPYTADVVDLSNPDAVVDAASGALTGMLATALDSLGQAGDVLKILLGVDPPGAVAAIDVVDLVRDPLGTIRAYYDALTGDSDAMAEALGALRALITGQPSVPVSGNGSAATPWRLLLGPDGAVAGLDVWRDGGTLVTALSFDGSLDVLDDLRVAAAIRAVLLTVDLTAGHASFVAEVQATASLRPRGVDPATIALVPGLDLVFAGMSITAGWSPATGFTVVPRGDGLTLDVRTATHVDSLGIPLPTLDAQGRWTFNPDWAAVEVLLGHLLRNAGSEVLDAFADVVGWGLADANVTRLVLADLVADPAAALEAWALALALDCANLGRVLRPVAWLLSGGSLSAPLGSGRPESHWRCPAGGVEAAPGLTVWTVPGCPTSVGTNQELTGALTALGGSLPPPPATVAAALAVAGAALPDVGDIVHARTHLGDGLVELVTRWAGTDGLVPPPATAADGDSTVVAADHAVTVTTVPGATYASLVAGARAGTTLQVVADPPIGTVHVGCDPDWFATVPLAEQVDATGPTPQRVPAHGDGTWFVLLPTPTGAAADRGDHDGVRAQADRLATALADRLDPVLLVGHGGAGAATVRATELGSLASVVDDVVTVGTPWGPVAATSLTTGLGGDALRLLQTLLPSDVTSVADPLLALGGSPDRRGVDLVLRSVQGAALADLPSALGVSRDASVRVHALFGRLTTADGEAAIAALAALAVESRRLAAAAAPTGPVQEVHAGFDIPVFDGEIGGLLLGAGAVVDLLAVDRMSPHLRTLREAVVDVRVAVPDGWIVGGPGASQHDLECRWLDVAVHVPLDGSSGSAVLTLHEARAYTAYRERWVVTGDATGAAPEVRVLLGEVVARMATVPALSALLAAVGLLRNGGLDPDGLDHLLFDTASTLRGAVANAPADLASALSALIGPTPGPALGPTQFRLAAGPASATIDLGAATVSGALTLADPLPVAVTLTAGPTGATVDCSVGALDTNRGGLALVGHVGPGGPTLRLDTAAPGGPTRPVALLPTADPVALLPVLTGLVPSIVVKILGDVLRGRAEGPLLDEVLAAAGLLGDADPEEDRPRPLLLPYGLLADPVAWVQRAVDPLALAVTGLDALASILTPARGAEPGWPLSDAVRITYAVINSRLELAALVTMTETIDGRPIVLDLTGGLSIGATGAPAAVVDARITVDGWGLDLGVGGTSDPPVRLDLVRPTPQDPIRLVPGGAGLGDALASGAQALIVLALNELLPHRAEATSLTQQVAQVAFEVCGALDLLVADKVDGAKLSAYAAPPGPGAVLLGRLPAIAMTGLAALAGALDPAHTVVATSLVGQARRFDLGHAVVGVRPFHVTVDGADLAVSFGCDVPLGTVGRLVVEELRLESTGVQVSVQAGPFAFDVGPTTLRPLVIIRAGVATGSFTRLLGLGVAIDGAGTESVQVRWALDTSPPDLYAVTNTTVVSVADNPQLVAQRLIGVAISLASGILADALAPILPPRATTILQGVVFTTGTQIDPDLAVDLLNPDALLARLRHLAWNCATSDLSVTIDGTVTIGLAAVPVSSANPSGPQRIGVRLDIPSGKTLVLSNSDPKVELVSHADWITGQPPEGLSIFVLEGTENSLDVVPGVEVAGIGLRFSGAAKPIIDLGGLSIDAIEVNLYGEATRTGLGGGIRLKLDGMSIAPAAGGGTNAVANSLTKDIGKGSGSSRPTFGPSFAIQKHPGEDVGVTLRAGDPPGPWWLVIQRQLGPLYVERIGLNTTESGGSVTSISLLFTGQVSLFGLAAAVDELSISWLGGDPAQITSWAVDLRGLAVAADIAGVSLSGGLLKLVDGGEVSYIGMLVGRFAAYGLSVFGGLTQAPDGTSFFIFGGVNGPFGGPPMFFLTGIGGGLGINRGLRIPKDISHFGEFPFIQALDPSAPVPDKPMDRLKDLAAYFPHEIGNFWFAAGISFTSFNLVDGVAVLAVSFGNGLDVNLFGLARMALPRPGFAIVSIELALLAHFSTSEGVFLIQAQLTDNSWLLYEDVRLTGGFAFAIWWKGPLAGQFVLTMGGYHPDFQVPVGYPVVPRLGLTWQLSDAIVIKGGSYFALTSEALMAGVDIEVSVDFGWVWARLQFGAHGIVYFDPFWFEVMAYARLSAGIDIDLPWPFGSISLSITIGAQVKVWGPDFAGHAEFEIGPCTVPVDFGSPRKVAPQTLDWGPFVTKYLEDAGGGVARALSAITGKGSLPTATTDPKGAPSADGSEDLPYQVFAEFELTVTTTVPATRLDLAGIGPSLSPRLSSGASTGLGLAPMGAATVGSTVRMTLEVKDIHDAWQPDSAHLQVLAANLVAASPTADGSRVTTESYPLGVWGSPKSLGATPSLPSTDVVTAPHQVTLVAGITALAVGPQIDYYRVEAARRPLPLHATGATRASFLKVSRDLPLPSPTTADAALTVAAVTLFPAVDDVLAPGQHSALARAAYRRDRVSPPRIAALTDGLAKDNGTNGERTTLDPVDGSVREARRPVVVGLLTSGVGAAARPGVTTVADGTYARRPAPTLDSVRGRLGAHLPVVLRQSDPPGLDKDGTILTSGALPRTDVAGSMRAYGGGRVGSPVLAGLVGGLGTMAGKAGAAPRTRSRAARANAASTTLRPGELVVLHFADAHVDPDPQRRPSLSTSGSARIVTVTGTIVTSDTVVAGGAAVVPAGTTLLAAHADAAINLPEGQVAGWVARSRLARLGSHVGLAAGCTLAVDVAGSAFAQGVTWTTAAEVTAAATQVVTRFAEPVKTVAVVLAGQAPSSLLPADVELVGAAPAIGPDGQPVPPVAVVLGSTTVLLQAVEPVDTGDLTDAGGGQRVVVRRGGAWTVTGVLGSVEDAATLARRIARDGLAAVTGKVLATGGPGTALTWEDAPTTRPRRAARGTSR